MSNYNATSNTMNLVHWQCTKFIVFDVALTLAVDGWAVTFGTARRGLGRAAARPGPSSLHKYTF